MNPARAPLSQRLRDEDFDNSDAIVTGLMLMMMIGVSKTTTKSSYLRNGQNKDAVISNLIYNQQEKSSRKDFFDHDRARTKLLFPALSHNSQSLKKLKKNPQ